jgi:hypothetical protein
MQVVRLRSVAMRVLRDGVWRSDGVVSAWSGPSWPMTSLVRSPMRKVIYERAPESANLSSPPEGRQPTGPILMSTELE